MAREDSNRGVGRVHREGFYGGLQSNDLEKLSGIE
jgi:hypothetical protein